MATTTETLRGRAALMVAHCAGMIDLVALPVWVGALIGHYKLNPQQAGMMATLFLVGAVIASVLLAPRLNQLRGRPVVAVCFAISASCFAGASQATSVPVLAVLHAVAGLFAGAALSVTHGTIARSANPHRGFALVGIALGVFAIVFFAVVPQLIGRWGGAMVFVAFACIMAAGALVAALAFPALLAVGHDAGPAAHMPGAGGPSGKIPAAVWWGIVGIACMGLVQSMTFSFLQRVGVDRGFGAQAVAGVLVALGFVNLAPAALAAVLEKRWNARAVLLAGPLVQAALTFTIMHATDFAPYAVAASVFAAVMIFTHTFAFGLLARLDPSGRAMAATPAMVMVGAAIGPVLGGSLIKGWGYGAIGIVALAIAVFAVVCFFRLPRHAPQAAHLPAHH